MRVADQISIKVFFVSICRIKGIPSRLSPGTLDCQVYVDSQWKDVFLDNKEFNQENHCKLIVKSNQKLEYYRNYTIGQFIQNKFVTMEFGNIETKYEGENTFVIPKGRYQFITGTREDTIYVQQKIFIIEKNTEIELWFNEKKKIQNTNVIFDNDRFSLNEFEVQHSYSIICYIDYTLEPSIHLLNDLKDHKQKFDSLENVHIYLVRSNNQQQQNDKNLPKNVTTKISDTSIYNYLSCDQSFTKQNPVILILNQKSQLLNFSEGYKIGLGNWILQNIL